MCAKGGTWEIISPDAYYPHFRTEHLLWPISWGIALGALTRSNGVRRDAQVTLFRVCVGFGAHLCSGFGDFVFSSFLILLSVPNILQIGCGLARTLTCALNSCKLSSIVILAGNEIESSMVTSLLDNVFLNFITWYSQSFSIMVVATSYKCKHGKEKPMVYKLRVCLLVLYV